MQKIALAIGICLSAISFGEHESNFQGVKLIDTPTNPAAETIVKCRQAFFGTKLIPVDSNDLVPGNPSLGFELGGCIFSSYGIYKINDEPEGFADEVVLSQTCLFELPYVGAKFVRELHTNTEDGFPTNSMPVRRLAPYEKWEAYPVCRVKNLELKSLSNIRSRVTDDSAASCLQKLGRYFDTSLMGQLESAFYRIQRTINGTWERENPISDRMKSKAHELLKANGLPLIKGVADERSRLLKKLSACENLPLPISEMGAYTFSDAEEKKNPYLKIPPNAIKDRVNDAIDKSKPK